MIVTRVCKWNKHVRQYLLAGPIGEEAETLGIWVQAVLNRGRSELTEKIDEGKQNKTQAPVAKQEKNCAHMVNRDIIL